jgi:hypothetical protein
MRGDDARELMHASEIRAPAWRFGAFAQRCTRAQQQSLTHNYKQNSRARAAVTAVPQKTGSRARAVAVRAVAMPSSVRARAKQQPQQSQQQQAPPPPAAAGKQQQQQRRSGSGQYNTWQSMAQHASQASATPSGFDESMM